MSKTKSPICEECDVEMYPFVSEETTGTIEGYVCPDCGWSFDNEWPNPKEDNAFYPDNEDHIPESDAKHEKVLIDIEDVKEFLRDSLRIEVEEGHWTEPNKRIISVMLDDEVITTASFDVVQKREYEG